MGDVSAFDCLALPKRQKVFEKTFLPVGDVLPVWSNVSLDTKLPVPPSHGGKFTLYTNKLGEPKYISRQRYDFDLTNPQGRAAPGPYDSLADPSLRFYFTSPRAKRHLVDNGLVTDRGEIKCTVQEFNQYREFIRYRAVTELALQKKREDRLKEESANRLFIDWPVSCHDDSNANRKPKLNKVERHRQTMSEPPRKNWTIGGLEMYEQNLVNIFKKRKEKKHGQPKNKNQVKKSKRKVKMNVDKNDEEKTVEGKENEGENTSEEEKSEEERDERKNPESTRSTHRGKTLVRELRQREKELQERLEQQRRCREEEHNRKLEESWRERQQRQAQLLQHEAEIEAMIREKRLRQIQDRERTLQNQRRKQEKQLMKIKKELAAGPKKPKSKPNKDGRENKSRHNDESRHENEDNTKSLHKDEDNNNSLHKDE